VDRIGGHTGAHADDHNRNPQSHSVDQYAREYTDADADGHPNHDADAGTMSGAAHADL